MENNVLLTEEEQAKLERRRRNKRFNAVLYCVSAALVLFGVYIILRDQTNIFDRNTAPVPEFTAPPEETLPAEIVIPTATPKPTEDPQTEPTKPPPTETPEPASAPMGVYFEGHDISVAVIPVGVDENGAMETVPKHDVAGWYMYGPAPNEEGNCIIAGHNRYNGKKGFFSILHEGLKVGDRVIVTMENGQTVVYEVETIENYNYDAVPSEVMEPWGETRLTLITCLGDYDHTMHMSRTRVVAVCKPIN